MKITIISLLMLLLSINTRADIAPNPVQAKGITVLQPTEIRMIYEKVTVDLTPDSSFVHCYFRLHNEGKGTIIQIGYPNMSIHSDIYRRNSKFAPLFVSENGKKIGIINTYAPDSVNPGNNNNNSRPWYLWDTNFEADETKEIVVTYSLPRGIVKNDLFYKFDYLLSTGAGWKGKIGEAEIVVNLKNLDKDLILKITPSNFTASDKQIVWKLQNIEPTSLDDITICYEKEKGDYSDRLKKVHFPSTVLDDKIILSYDIRDNNSIQNLNLHEIASAIVINQPDSTILKLPHTDNSYGLFLIYSKRFAVDKLSEIIKPKFQSLADDLKSKSVSYFEDNFSLVINDKIIRREKMTEKIISIEMSSIIDISVKEKENKHKEIIIKHK